MPTDSELPSARTMRFADARTLEQRIQERLPDENIQLIAWEEMFIFQVNYHVPGLPGELSYSFSGAHDSLGVDPQNPSAVANAIMTQYLAVRNKLPGYRYAQVVPPSARVIPLRP